METCLQASFNSAFPNTVGSLRMDTGKNRLMHLVCLRGMSLPPAMLLSLDRQLCRMEEYPPPPSANLVKDKLMPLETVS